MKNLINYIYSLFSTDIGIDLGTANTLVFVKGKGIILSEPSIVAIDTQTKEILAVGERAKLMVGRTPAHIKAIRPLKDGVIADFEATQKMIRYFIEKIHNRRFLVSPRIVIGVPSGITEVEKRAVQEAADLAGAKEVWLIEEPLAAAIGADIPVHEPSGNMVVDIGGGTTEVAVISLGGMVVAKSIRVAGDKLDEAIINYVKKEHDLLIGDRTAEEVKIKLGSAFPLEEEDNISIEIKGRDIREGLPKIVHLTQREVREALSDTVEQIVNAVKETLEQTPPELASDIIEKGIVLTGGGALLKGLDKLISSSTKLPVHIPELPLICVAAGTGKYLEEADKIKPQV